MRKVIFSRGSVLAGSRENREAELKALFADFESKLNDESVGAVVSIVPCEIDSEALLVAVVELKETKTEDRPVKKGGK